jgi:hypothetical protein
VQQLRELIGILRCSHPGSSGDAFERLSFTR